MGFGCNAAGIIGCRIIDSPREKLISIITNAFVPCNGRFPFLITISTIFIGSFFAEGSSFLATLCVLAIILLGIFMTPPPISVPDWPPWTRRWLWWTRILA